MACLLGAQTSSFDSKRYLDKALDTIQKNFYKTGIDWAEMRRQAYAAVGASAQKPADVYPGIIAAIAFLHERHSFFISAEEAKAEAKGQDKSSGFWCDGDIVSDVVEGSPADRAGIRMGMQVVSVNDQQVGSAAKANRLIFSAEDTGHVAVVLKTADGSSVSKSLTVEQVSLLRDPYGFITQAGCAYVEVPAFIGEPKLAQHYADTLQAVIRKLDAQNPKGWIVDLRRNSGGNMYPMIAGLGPVVGEGQLGCFLGQKSKDFWFYRRGASGEGRDVFSQAGHPYRLTKRNPPVAVLVSHGTASSGEICAISFLGRPGTRLFGTATAGLTTANDVFPLSDGAQIVLTTSSDGDRFGSPLSGAVKPDEIVPPSWAKFDAPDDPDIVAAEKWIGSVPSSPQAKG